MSDNIPGPTRLDNVRWSRGMMRDVPGTLIALHEEFGDMAALGVGRFRAINLDGPEASPSVDASRTTPSR